MAIRLSQTLRTVHQGFFSASRSSARNFTSRNFLVGTALFGTAISIIVQPNFHWKERFILLADSATVPDLRIQNQNEGYRQDPDTSILHPIRLPLLSISAPLTLVGLGVRTVSFLRVKVYSAAFYIDETLNGRLNEIPGFHNYTATHLNTPPSTSSDPLQAPQLSGEALMGNLLDSGASCAIRIVPVRNTDFGHLRDGFTRAIAARQKIARKTGELTEVDDARIAESVQILKSFFPTQSVPKGNSLILLRSKIGLTVEYEGKILGKVDDPWVARELMMAYFADKDVISQKLRNDVAAGLENFVKH